VVLALRVRFGGDTVIFSSSLSSESDGGGFAFLGGVLRVGALRVAGDFRVGVLRLAVFRGGLFEVSRGGEETCCVSSSLTRSSTLSLADFEVDFEAGFFLKLR